MAHPSSSDGDNGSRQRVWTKRWRALRHFAVDRVDKLLEWSFRKFVDDHADQRAVVDCRCEQPDEGLASETAGSDTPTRRKARARRWKALQPPAAEETDLQMKVRFDDHFGNWRWILAESLDKAVDRGARGDRPSKSLERQECA